MKRLVLNVLYFFAGAELVAINLKAPDLQNSFLLLIMLFGGILIGITVTEKEKEQESKA